LLQGQGARGAAADCYRQALRLNPGLAEAAQRLAQVTEGRSEPSPSENSSPSEGSDVGSGIVSNENPAMNAEDWLNLGIQQHCAGQYEEAIASYDQAIHFKPNDHDVWSNRGIVLRNLGRYEEAIASFDQAIHFKPDDYNAWGSRGNALANLGRYEEAIASYDRAIHFKPTDYNAWSNRGVTLADFGQYEEAIASFDQAIRFKPDSHHGWSNRGNALANLERYEEAIVSFDQAIHFKPDWHEASYNRGLALADLGRYEEAIASYDQAIHFKPDFHEAWQNRASGICHLNRDRLPTASLLSAIQQNSIPALRHPQPHIAALQEAFPFLTEHTVGWAQIHLALGDAYLKHRNWQNLRDDQEKALSSYHKALPILTEAEEPEAHLQILQGLMKVYLTLNKPQMAQEYRNRGLKVLGNLLSDRTKSLDQKKQIELKFSGFSRIAVDVLLRDGQSVLALEAADRYKNRCLTSILREWQETVLSPSYPEMRSLLTPTTAIVCWHISDHTLTTFLLLPDCQEIYTWTIDLINLQNWLKIWDRDYQNYRNLGKDKTSELRFSHPWRTQMEDRFKSLRQILQIDLIIAKMNSQERSLQSLILIPHRDLHRLPLGILFPCACTSFPSLQTALTRRSSTLTPASPTKSLIITDPPTDTLLPMPYAQLEGAIVRTLMPDHTPIPSRDHPAATLETVIHQLQQPHTLCHFTGHGAYDRTNPETSALQLTDGILTARAIAALDLSHYHLISLAACETGITENRYLDREYIGLASAFLQAGASTLLSTLWNVDEIASAWFMIHFYQQIGQGTKPAMICDRSATNALQHTQQWLQTCTWQQLAHWLTQLLQQPNLEDGIRDRLSARITNIQKKQDTIEWNHPTDYCHPYYWAAFILSGQS
jgi:tetratricopeptide (TPR) repeat protein